MDFLLPYIPPGVKYWYFTNYYIFTEPLQRRQKELYYRISSVILLKKDWEKNSES